MINRKKKKNQVNEKKKTKMRKMEIYKEKREKGIHEDNENKR